MWVKDGDDEIGCDGKKERYQGQGKGQARVKAATRVWKEPHLT